MQTFCCCCSVRVGTLVIGTLGWIGNLANLIYSIAGLVQAKAEHDPANSNSTEFIQKLFIAFMVGTSVGLLLNILLVVGVHKKIKNLMLPWIILSFMGNTIITFVVVIRFFILLFAERHQGGMMLETLILILFCKLSWYFCICVWSHYKEIRDEQTIVTLGGVQLAHRIDNETTDYKDGASPI